MPVCAKCGAFVGELEKQCPSCGTSLTSAAAPAIGFGFRVGEPEKTRAVDVIKFEVEELGNDHMITDVAAALGTARDLASLEAAIRQRFGEDATGMWLCMDPEWAKKRYGPGDLYKVMIPVDAIIGSDLGDDGQFWIWRKQPGQEEIVEEGPNLVDEVVNSGYWAAAVRKIPPLITDEDKATFEYEDFANLLEMAGAHYSAELVRRQIAAVEKHHAELLKSIQERMKRLV